jgi:hypothetical protein
VTDIVLLVTSSSGSHQTSDNQDLAMFASLTADTTPYPAMASLSDYIVQASDDFFLSSNFMNFGPEEFSCDFEANFPS